MFSEYNKKKMEDLPTIEDNNQQEVVDNEEAPINEDKKSRKYSQIVERNLKLSSINGKVSEEITKAHLNRKQDLSEEININQKEINDKNYKIKNLIGSGSYAHVFKAKDLNKHRIVALKMIQTNRIKLNNSRKMFLKREIEVIRQLEHSNIIKYFVSFNTHSAYVMVMEYADNGTFADYIFKNGVMSDSLARNLFKGVSDGMVYMHKKLIAHRDLKLENFLLTKKMVPKISDFSLSLTWDGDTLCEEFCGTPPYFAPEIFLKKPYNPLAYDMWSLGVSVYVVLNDTLPFVGANDEEIVKKQLNCRWSCRKNLESQISEEAKTIIGQLLNPEAKTRITSEEFNQCKWFTRKKLTIKQHNN